MMIVKVRHPQLNGAMSSRVYLFATKRKLKEGDWVLVQTANGKEATGLCVSDSMEVSKSVLDFLSYDAPWQWPLSSVIGKMDRWEG